MPEPGAPKKTKKPATSSTLRSTSAHSSLASNSPAYDSTRTLQRAQVDPRSLVSPDVLYLQRTVGNRATGQLLSGQMKVPMGARPLIQRSPVAPTVGAKGGPIPEQIEANLRSNQSGGSALPDKIRRTLEPKLQTDLSPVRVHTDAGAAKMTANLGAKAFTHGKHIYYGAGQSPNDLKLTTHETVHTIQQKALNPVNGSNGKVQKKPASIQRVFSDTATTIDWSKAQKVTPSSDGAKGGVMFVRMPTGMHIVKAVRNAASVLFAEKLVGEISGAETTESIPIRNSKAGESKLILDMLASFESKETDPKIKEVWTRNLPFFMNSPYLMVQKAMSGSPMDKVREEKPMMILDNPKLLEQMGRTLAADTLVGNADRFENMNTGNAFVTDKGNVGAIDTEAILQSHAGFSEFLKTGTGMVFEGKDPISAWVKFLVGDSVTGAGMEMTKEGTGGPSSEPRRLQGHFDDWFEKSFKFAFVKNDKGGMIPKKFNWDKAKLSVKSGFDEGLRKINEKFSGENFKKTSKQFTDLETQSGQTDENFNLEALKVKATYMKSSFSGESHDEAFGSAIDMAGGRGGAIDSAVSLVTSHDAKDMDVFGRPSEMTSKEKSARNISRAKNLEKEGKALKKLSRSGGSDPELEDEVRKGVKEGTADRSAQKAIYEISLKRFLKTLEVKTQKLAFLDDIAIRGRGKSAHPSMDTELAIKRYTRLKELLETGARSELFYMGSDVTKAKDEWSNTFKMSPEEDTLNRFAKKKLNGRLTSWNTSLNTTYEAFVKTFTSFREHSK